MKTFTLALFLFTLAAVALAGKAPKSAKTKANSAPINVNLRTSQRQFLSDCDIGCNFRFCDFVDRLFIGSPNVPVSRPICRIDNFMIGVVETTGEAIVSRLGSPLQPIGDFDPAGLSPGFPENFFTTVTLTEFGTNVSGIGTLPFAGNQGVFAEGLCVRLPILSYLGRSSASVPFQRFSALSPFDCIAFTTRVPRLTIELEWNTGDDLELDIIEPNGAPINDETGGTPSGFLLDDITDQCNFSSLLRHERVVFLIEDPVQNGIYTIRARHFLNCGTGPSTWTIRVFSGTALVTSRTGVSNQDDDQIILNSSFQINVLF